MPRKLSEEPEKRRLQLFRAIYNNYYVWQAQVESDNLHFLNVEGEDVHFHDLLVGLDSLPPRQRQAFVLHILFGWPEKKAAEEMGLTKWVTLVGQYSTAGLRRMVEAYDCTDRNRVAV